jgi:hypothetical protein
MRLANPLSVLLIAVTFLGLSALAMSGRGWLAFGKEVAAPTVAPETAAGNVLGAAQDTPKVSPIQTVRFALHDAGILPQEAHAQKGQISITIHDLSGGTEGLIVERETGNAPERVTHVHRGQQYGRGKETLELTPGTYQVRDASRPENRATLIIEP